FLNDRDHPGDRPRATRLGPRGEGGSSMRFWFAPARFATIAAILVSLVATGVAYVPAQGSPSMTLRITWFKWPPADLLQQVGNLYTQSHPNIKIVVDEPP